MAGIFLCCGGAQKKVYMVCTVKDWKNLEKSKGRVQI